ncbi:subtilisin-like serine protease family protein [Rhizoctonia solani 123E]|uniref:Subtilisin-like serine protease family protein n=1 Tax=Rhizoctonia solani 123E TaxID=1423351 RepID=A0A074RRS0_9AGAM|nr:subtilisin-like serine protease family protein [Rhizoctonia solani 123E]
MITFALVAVLLAFPALGSPLSTSAESLIPGGGGLDLAPIISRPSAEQTAIPNQYIVVLKPEATLDDLNAHAAAVQSYDESNPLIHIFDGPLKGVVGKFSDATVDKIRAMPKVGYVERDQMLNAVDRSITKRNVVTQRGAPWGLARISHQERLSFRTFDKYIYNDQGGTGVDVYVIDSGINIGHVDFEGRAHWGHTVPAGDRDEDGNGQGTHCAGTIAGKTYGVAKKAQVYAVKVLRSNGSGSVSDAIAGVNWASKQAQARAIEAIKEFRATGKTSHKGSVANMFSRSNGSSALNDAVNAAVRNGMHFAAAAGDNNSDACDYSPAAAELPIIVGASTISDDRASFSNYGKCLDIFAPGRDITSTWIGNKYAINTISGTSMASSHTAGLLAYLLSLQDPRSPAPGSGDSYYNADGSLDVTQFGAMTPAELLSILIDLSGEDKLSNIPPLTNNFLIYNNEAR